MWLTAAVFGSMSALAGQVEERIDGASGVALRGVEGDVEVVAGADDTIRIESTGDADVRLDRRGAVWVVTVRRSDAGTKLQVTVPASLAALTVHEQVGRLVVRNVPTQLAVISGRGPVEVTGVDSLRVSYTEGDVTADHVEGTLAVDRLGGALDVRSIGGDVVVSTVVGAVTVDDVVGNLAVTGAAAGVKQTNIRGTVSL